MSRLGPALVVIPQFSSVLSVTILTPVCAQLQKGTMLHGIKARALKPTGLHDTA